MATKGLFERWLLKWRLGHEFLPVPVSLVMSTLTVVSANCSNAIKSRIARLAENFTVEYLLKVLLEAEVFAVKTLLARQVRRDSGFLMICSGEIRASTTIIIPKDSARLNSFGYFCLASSKSSLCLP
jgi:hypothetical protein